MSLIIDITPHIITTNSATDSAPLTKGDLDLFFTDSSHCSIEFHDSKLFIMGQEGK